MKSKIDMAQLKLRVIYLVVLVALSWPLITNYSLPPAEMQQANKVHDLIEQLDVGENGVVLISMDFGPSTIAENMPQTEAIMEHLMRRRIPFAVMSLYALASPFLESVPEDVAERLAEEYGDQKWEYGKDWVNLGFQPGGGLFLQSIPKSKNLVELMKKDARGTPLGDIPVFKNVRTIEDIKMVAEMTGLTGMFNAYLQFLKSETYTPLVIHGCTSITIPDAYIYLDSGQLNGLFEGIAGAAWYSTLLKRSFPNRASDNAQLINTSLGVAHLVLIALIIIGNLEYFFSRKRKGLAS